MKSVNTTFHIPDIDDDGWKFVSVMAIITVVAALIWLPLGIVFLLLDIWCFLCFRNPDRVTPVLSSLVVAPADGTVVSISKEKGPDCIGLQNKKFHKIRIYSGCFDVHINRMPIKAKVGSVFYDCGKNFSGSFEVNNIGNETFAAVLKHSEGFDFALKQTAVLCSKRIVSKLEKGNECLTGQRIGLIRFGGYVDVFLPEKVCPQVCVGQTMVAGETVIADIKSDAPRLEGEIR
ncbi:MAG: phosphatidylserine decarboxylase [Alphaproteobacteria bacterium]|nr:phosphatidylserine decarboxylase [Alphaproteobacteria bacterium]